ncbi:MAG: type II secretion system F family protein [Ilumatobacter sp.]|uniref:type II secretion system F family protein n=1 Tax=Ilumatobacter sp. TaxID=1967498 RepID=UPI003299D8AF
MTLLAASLAALAVALVVAPTLLGRSTRPPNPSARRLTTSEPAVDRWADRRRRLARRLRRRAHVVQPVALSAWADDLARALRHGSTLRAALTNTVPTDAVVERRSASLRHWLERGSTVAEACDEWSIDLAAAATGRGRPTGQRIELLVTMSAVLAAAGSLGGAAAAPLDRFAVTMRQRASDDLERGAQSAQAQMSAKVLTSVPLAVLALLLLTDDGVRGVITSATGGVVVTFGLTLNALGAVWMNHIVGSRTAGR